MPIIPYPELDCVDNGLVSDCEKDCENSNETNLIWTNSSKEYIFVSLGDLLRREYVEVDDLRGRYAWESEVFGFEVRDIFEAVGVSTVKIERIPTDLNRFRRVQGMPHRCTRALVYFLKTIQRGVTETLLPQDAAGLFKE